MSNSHVADSCESRCTHCEGEHHVTLCFGVQNETSQSGIGSDDCADLRCRDSLVSVLYASTRLGAQAVLLNLFGIPDIVVESFGDLKSTGITDDNIEVDSLFHKSKISIQCINVFGIAWDPGGKNSGSDLWKMLS